MSQATVTYSVQLCVVIDKECGKLRVPPVAVGSSNEDATLEPDGIVVERAVSGSLSNAVRHGALLINAEVEELGALRLGLPGAGAALLVLVRVTILKVLLICRVVFAVIIAGLFGRVARLRRVRSVSLNRVAMLSRVLGRLRLSLVLSGLRLVVLRSGLGRVLLCRVITGEYSRGASQAEETECQEVGLHLEMSEWEGVSGMNVVDKVDGRGETPITRIRPIYGERDGH